MNINKTIVYELLLLFASVLIFRSLWMIFDRITFMNENFGIYASLVLGILITIYSLIRLNKIIDKKEEG